MGHGGGEWGEWGFWPCLPTGPSAVCSWGLKVDLRVQAAAGVHGPGQYLRAVLRSGVPTRGWNGWWRDPVRVVLCADSGHQRSVGGA